MIFLIVMNFILAGVFAFAVIPSKEDPGIRMSVSILLILAVITYLADVFYLWRFL